MWRIVLVVLACGVAPSARAAWSVSMSPEGMTAAGSDVSVDCASGDVRVPLPAVALWFDAEPVKRAVAASDGVVRDGLLAGQMAGHDGGVMHLDGPEGTLDVDLTGVADAFWSCGLAVTPDPHPDAWKPPVVDGFAMYEPPTYRLVRQVNPTFPPGLTTRVVCRGDAWFDERGVPFHVELSHCPDVARTAAETALVQWKWRPVKVDGQAVMAHTIVALAFDPYVRPELP